VLIRGEAHAIAVTPAVRLVGESSDGEEIVGLEQRERVVARQPLAALDLVAMGASGDRPSITPPAEWRRHVVPAEPEEFESARHVPLHALLGADRGRRPDRA